MTSLNEQQQTAVNLDDDKILCLAGAGTGKTFCMISRISRIVDSGIDPSNILVLTFTHAAAFEMKERYQRTHLNQRTPAFHTFHSFCYRLLASDINVRKKLGYFKVPAIADKGTVKRLQTSARMQSGVKLSNKILAGKMELTPAQKSELDIYNKTLYRVYRQENVITFDTLCYKVCKLFVDNDECIQPYKDRYQYIFVDEFQDTDPRQYEFIKSFENAKLFVVGDALQSIYSFRGADSSIIKRLSDDDDWTTVKLFQNYRSTKQICNFANTMSTYADDTYRIAINSEVRGNNVNVFRVHDSYQSYDDDPVDSRIISRIVDCIDSSSGTSAILCRTNKEVDCVLNYLERHHIPHFTGKKNTDNLHILKSTADNEYLVDWLSTYLTADNYAAFIRMITISEDKTPLQILIDEFGGLRYIKPKLDKIFQIRRIFKGNGLKEQKCIDALSALDINVSGISVDISNATTISQLMNCLISVINSDESANIYVGTIHSSKGLEYDNVYLIGVDGSYFRLTNEENLNLYYVGITRAKSNLYVFRTEQDVDEDDMYDSEFSTGPEDD